MSEVPTPPGRWTPEGQWQPSIDYPAVNTVAGLPTFTEAYTDHHSSRTTGIFRSRAVFVAGLVDFLLGALVLITGVVMAFVWTHRDAAVFGAAISILGVIVLFTGLGRVTAG